MNAEGSVEPADTAAGIGPRPGNRATIRQLQFRGLSAAEATNVAAYLAGIRPSVTPWTLPQIERLLFVRWLVDAGRLLS